jgi:hypothetical protein
MKVFTISQNRENKEKLVPDLPSYVSIYSISIFNYLTDFQEP